MATVQVHCFTQRLIIKVEIKRHRFHSFVYVSPGCSRLIHRSLLLSTERIQHLLHKVNDLLDLILQRHHYLVHWDQDKRRRMSRWQPNGIPGDGSDGKKKERP